MSQSINLSVSGEYTSLNDFNGLPPGALDEALNVESRYKNTLEPRRGFDSLIGSILPDGAIIIRQFNFTVLGVDSVVCLSSLGNAYYYDPTSMEAVKWLTLPGNSTGITPPEAVNGKSRFIRGNQNLYLTSQDGVRSMATGSGSLMVRAGVPQGLNLDAETNGDLEGFFDNNVVLATTANLVSGSALISDPLDTTGVAIGNFVTGSDLTATTSFQGITYSSVLFGAAGNAITVAYTNPGINSSPIAVTVTGNAISVSLATNSSGVLISTATTVAAAIVASTAASALVMTEVTSGATTQTIQAPTSLSGGLDNTIPLGAKVIAIADEATVLVETGSTTAGSASITGLTSNAGLVAGLLVAGTGIPETAKMVSISGSGPYTVLMDQVAFQTSSTIPISFTAPVQITMDQNAVSSQNNTPVTFYAGGQVGYRLVFGRVEQDNNGGSITRLGPPSAIAIATNISPSSTNVTVIGTIPKNASDEITFVQLYRSQQTPTISVTPLDQYNLVYEAALTGTDFTNRVVTITDDVPDSLVGIPLYAGADQEGILQSNNAPPMSYDMCVFRGLALYFNITQPTSTKFTLTGVGSPNGVQIGDTLTVSGTFQGVSYTETYTAASSENALARQFQVVSSGTPAQNITDTVNSLIRVINYDESLPVHAILLSTSTDLPGQIFLQADNPSLDTFTVNAIGHPDAYDPTLTDLVSEVNTTNNGVCVSKNNQLESVPAANLLPVGDSSSPIYRGIALRDYVIVVKSDGIYKIQGTTPSSLVVNPFDLTTKIIGADTAVSLNSGVWMLSNQGVVSIDDGGVNAKSIPIDDQLNLLIDSFLTNLQNQAFAVGYESDRKYILSVPTTNNAFTDTQHIFNYVTNCWTRWDRLLYSGFIHSNEGRLYISRADVGNKGASVERKSATYTDYADEAVDVTVSTVVDGTDLILADISNVSIGDIFQQGTGKFSPVLEINPLTNTITVQSDFSWTTGAAEVLASYQTAIEWKEQFGQNPSDTKQFSEGQVLFKNTRFNTADINFSTDFSQSTNKVTLVGTSTGSWGIFPWGGIPWGGIALPSVSRFIIPQDKQFGSYIIPRLEIKQAYSNFKVQGLSISYYTISQEVGR